MLRLFRILSFPISTDGIVYFLIKNQFPYTELAGFLREFMLKLEQRVFLIAIRTSAKMEASYTSLL